MDIKQDINEHLWTAIEKNYELGNYTGAILDATYYLADFIREKTGLQSDGVALVGEALGGKSPKLRVNKLQTESEVNVQKGTQNLLFGLFQSVRNPRSHEKVTDIKEDADAIVLFVNYLLKIIGAAKGAFSKDEFMKRVFDPAFVEKERYAELLVESIPARHRFDVMCEVYRRKEEGKVGRLALFSKALLKTLGEDDASRLAEVVCEELKSTDSENPLIYATHIFPIEFWMRLDESIRLRCENTFHKSVTEGEYVAETKKCKKGVLGTWCTDLVPYFVMRDDFIGTLIDKLDSSKRTEQDYVLQFFTRTLLKELHKTGEGYIIWASEVIILNLKAGDKRFYILANSAINSYKVPWKDRLNQAFESFKEVKAVRKRVRP